MAIGSVPLWAGGDGPAPAVSGAEAAVLSAAGEMKKAGMIGSSVDVEQLAKRAFAHLDGVTDDWLQSLKVEKVAGGQVPPDQDERLRRELAQATGDPWCSMVCCISGIPLAIASQAGPSK